MSQSLFLFISVLGLLAALGTVLARNLIHAALHLVAFFFIVACQFVLLEAEFLAAIQVLVYIGAVAILLMFGIMLTRNIQGDDTTSVPRGWIVPGLLAALGLFFVLAFGINDHVGLKGRGDWAAIVRRPSAAEPARAGDAATTRAPAINDMGRVVGEQLVRRYAVPFEVAGVLLTAALVGAIALAHRDTEDDASPLRGLAADRPASSGNGDGRSESPATTSTTTGAV